MLSPGLGAFSNLPHEVVLRFLPYLDKQSILNLTLAHRELREIFLPEFFSGGVSIDPTSPYTSSKLPDPLPPPSNLSILSPERLIRRVTAIDGGHGPGHLDCGFSNFLQRLSNPEAVSFHSVNFLLLQWELPKFLRLSKGLCHVPTLVITGQRVSFPPHILANCVKLKSLTLDFESISLEVTQPYGRWLLDVPYERPVSPEEISFLGGFRTKGMKLFGDFLATSSSFFSLKRVDRLRIDFQEWWAYGVGIGSEQVDGKSGSEVLGRILRHAGEALRELTIEGHLSRTRDLVVPASDLLNLVGLRVLDLVLVVSLDYFRDAPGRHVLFSDVWLNHLLQKLPSPRMLEVLKLHYRIHLYDSEGDPDDGKVLVDIRDLIFDKLDCILFGSGAFENLRRVSIQLELTRNFQKSLAAEPYDFIELFPSAILTGASLEVEEAWVHRSIPV